MSTIQVPFETAEERGTSLSLQVPDQNLIRSFIPNEPPPLADVAGAARYAVENPVGSKPLSALVQPGMNVVIITENQFRAAPANLILPSVIEIIERAGGKPCIAIGNGKVPPLSPQEIEEKLGKEV